MVSKLVIKFLNKDVRPLDVYIENSRYVSELKERIKYELTQRSTMTEGTEE